VQPPESRPGMVFSPGKKIPVVDLRVHDRDETIKHILKASKDYGFFQVLSQDFSFPLS